MDVDMDKITVVVPIYRVEQYLERCIDSILGQSYENLEIILVDDGSPDGCPEICDAYALRDKRIIVIHKENGGLSDARNVAIEIASGEYITFIDSDDYVRSDMLETLYVSLNENHCDIATCDFNSFYDDAEIKYAGSDNVKKVYTGEDALEIMLYQKDLTNSAWGKLYRRDLFANIRYPKGRICEDLATTYKLFSNSARIVVNSARLYYYMQREDSIINSTFSQSRMSGIEFAAEELNYIQKMRPEILASAQNRLFMEAIFTVIQIPNGDRNYTERLKCYEIVKQLRKTVLLDSKSKKIYRLLAFSTLFSVGAPAKIYRIRGLLNKFRKF